MKEKRKDLVGNKKLVFTLTLVLLASFLVISMPISSAYNESRLDEFTDYSLDNWDGLTDSDVTYRNDTYISANESVSIDEDANTELARFKPLENETTGEVQVWYNLTTETRAEFGILGNFNYSDADLSRYQWNFSTASSRVYFYCKNGSSMTMLYNKTVDLTGVSGEWFKMTMDILQTGKWSREINCTLQHGGGTTYYNNTEDGTDYIADGHHWGMLHKSAPIIIDDYGDPDSSGGPSVTDSDPSDGATVTMGQEYSPCLWVNFSEPVDVDTVVANETLLLENYRGSYTLTWYNDNTTLSICHQGLDIDDYTLNITFYDLSSNVGYYDCTFRTWNPHISVDLNRRGARWEGVLKAWSAANRTIQMTVDQPSTQTNESVTHGSYAGASDLLPVYGDEVKEIVEVGQSGTIYTETTDYILDGNYIDWSPDGSEPATDSSYWVNYTYNLTTSSSVTLHNMTASRTYDITFDNVAQGDNISDGEGDIGFTYGSWSTHTFTFLRVGDSSTDDDGGGGSSTSSTTDDLTLTEEDDSEDTSSTLLINGETILIYGVAALILTAVLQTYTPLDLQKAVIAALVLVGVYWYLFS